MGLDVMILVFWMLSFKPTFSFSFTFIKRLFSSSSHSAIRVVLFAYLRLLIFLPAVLIPACASSSPAFHMMYSAYKLNKQGDNIQPCRTLFEIWNQTAVPRLALIVDSWPAYRFLRRQVRWSDKWKLSLSQFHRLRNTRSRYWLVQLVDSHLLDVPSCPHHPFAGLFGSVLAPNQVSVSVAKYPKDPATWIFAGPHHSPYGFVLFARAEWIRPNQREPCGILLFASSFPHVNNIEYNQSCEKWGRLVFCLVLCSF